MMTNNDDYHYDLFKDYPSKYSYDIKGDIVAEEGIIALPPWKVLPSKQVIGRFFFCNTESGKSQWTLPAAFIEMPSDGQLKQKKDFQLVEFMTRNNVSKTTDGGASTSSRTSIDIVQTSEQTMKLPSISSFDSASSSQSPTSVAVGGSGSLDTFSKYKLPPNISLPPTHRPSFSFFSRSLTRSVSSSLSGDQSLLHIEEDILDDDEHPMFTVTEGLGGGGFAVVVKAQHLETKKNYAMKVIKKNVSHYAMKREIHKAQLNFELEVMTKVKQSPFVQKCKYAFESTTSVYFLLDLNSGGDLFYHLVKRIEDGRSFSEKECRIMLAEIYLALEHIHLQNIIHHDIKIENIMLTSEGHIKLVDFGLALQMEGESFKVKGTGGSLSYMAPELLQQHRIGGRFTDWWAYGILAYELLTGRSPWSSLNDTAKIKWEIQNLTVLVTSDRVSKRAAKFIGTLLTHDIEKRLGTKRDDEIRSSSFFKTINWDKTAKLQCPPAFIPNAINVNKEDQDDALEGYRDLVFETNDTLKKGGNQWMLGLPSHTDFLL